MLGNQFETVSPSTDLPTAFTGNLPNLASKLQKSALQTEKRDTRINIFFYLYELKIAISNTKNTAPGHDRVWRLHDIVGKSLANKYHVLAVLTDITKAYDTVCTDALLFKLLNMGIYGRMFNSIRSFLTNHSFQVRVGSKLSLVKYQTNGTPQGSILNPILFSIVITDLPNGIRSPIAFYANDFSFWESGSSIKQLNDLCLAKVAEWRVRSEFKISQSKSTAVLFTTKRKCQEISLKRYEEIIPIKTEHRFMGVTFLRNGTYNSHIQQIHSKCLRRLKCYPTANWHYLRCSKTTAAKHLQNTRSLCDRVRHGNIFLLIKVVTAQTYQNPVRSITLMHGSSEKHSYDLPTTSYGEISPHVKHILLC